MKARVLSEEAMAETGVEAETLETGRAVPALLSGKRPRLVIRCGKDYLEILELQVQGKKAMETRAFLNGYLAHDIVLSSSV